ncbi:uncharacterized protein LACBIDRAFT_306420 [Laccaria bicolor S238N-H82]|uniref:Predicted protein n=1 Tax=Laccaria bicolor (strain S238N-H82 / ATCC MYA-4686) TaxID=486041 RepID=B0DMV7_LACBS|nr:uncharacterized protein LACBIDRAFT_306420 [Laccaria bicolor S238N-H82]EDR04039.1 predicted protein [Laccaria bicolor S238N-H82]|eukprot:XP_001885294.1 predicted protein [Laccaria bicolor S238N-H82]
MARLTTVLISLRGKIQTSRCDIRLRSRPSQAGRAKFPAARKSGSLWMVHWCLRW